jgi:hypothetical protein
MILIYTEQGEIPKEILTDMKKHNLVVKNQLVFVSIPLEPIREQEELENFKQALSYKETLEHTTPMGKKYFISNPICLY